MGAKTAVEHFVIQSKSRPWPWFSEPLKRSLWVILFAIAMAWMESSVVVYLRLLVNRLQPYQEDPLPKSLMTAVGPAELVREAATILMLWAIGRLAGDTRRNRFGHFIIAFGVWDIFYYVFLRIICGWPKTIWDWDILFLLPLPWWGPVLSPVLIALLMIVAGLLLSLCDTEKTPLWPRRSTQAAGALGATMALIVFMSDAISVAVAGRGAEAVRRVLPAQFHWGWFLAGVILIAIPVVDMACQVGLRRRHRYPDPVIEN